MARETVHLTENFQEDFQLDTNPSAFLPYEDSPNPKDMKVIGTRLSPEYVAYIDSHRYAMGNVSMIYGKFVKAAGGINVLGEISEVPAGATPFIIKQPQILNRQSLQPRIRGLLHLPEYIKARIIDISAFLSFSKKYNFK